MEYFVGLDVSLRSCAVCIVDNKGKVAFERELPCEIEDIAFCLRQFPYPVERLGFKADTMSQHLFFGLQAEGFEVVCMEARQVPDTKICDRTAVPIGNRPCKKSEGKG